MNYQRIYDQIIDRARIRVLEKEIYREKHHIIPKCLGGSDDKENLVELTAREHFLCHWLLVRIFPENNKLSFAFWSMCKQKTSKQLRYTPSSRVYEEARQSFNNTHGRIWSNEENRKIRSEQVKEVWKNPKRKASHIEIHLGKKRSEESKQNMRKPHSAHKFRSNEHIVKLTSAITNRRRVNCNKCGKDIQYCYFEKHQKSCI